MRSQKLNRAYKIAIIGADLGKPMFSPLNQDTWYYEGSTYKVGLRNKLYKQAANKEWLLSYNDKRSICTKKNLLFMR